MREPHPRRALLVGAGSALVLLAAVALLLPGIGFVQAMTDAGVSVTDGPKEVHLAAHQRYGIYVSDPDNSGYSESCSVTESGGRAVRLEDPGFTLSSSDTEMLDYVFDSGSGDLTISCAMTDATAEVRRTPNYLMTGAGALVAVAALGVAIGLLLIGLLPRPAAASRQTTDSGSSR